MMRSLPKTISLPGFPADALEGRIALARASLGVERLLPSLWPALGFAGLYIAAALFGLFKFIPWPLQSLLLAAAVTATALALARGFADFAWPGDDEGARRLERDSGLLHRPISERDDALPTGARDPLTLALWQAHRTRMAALGPLRVAGPRADLNTRDPKGLRWLLLIALAAGLVIARNDIGPRLIRAFDSGAGASVSIDAWIDPPAYTGLPLQPVTLSDKDLTIPAGSKLALRVHGAPHAPGLSAGANPTKPFHGSDGDYATDTPIVADAHLRVRVAGHVVANWRVHALADTVPSIAFVGIPSRTEHDAVKFTFHASDDYGVTGVRAILTPHGRPGAPPLIVPLDGSGRSIDLAAYADLTAHPYAGLMVDAKLEARDGAGQKGLSAPVTFRLPARVFTDPLARALIEQRQNLATANDAAARAAVTAMLDALAIAPDKFYADKTGVYLALRAAYWGTRNARGPSDITHVEELLWQTAVALERGGLLTAAEELRKLQALLTQAMLQGAPQDVIDALLNRYNEAMKRYLDAMAANPPPPGPPASKDAVTMGSADIQKMLDLIHKLTQSGQREQAAQMLAMLQNMLENLHMTQGSGGSGSGSPQNKALNDAINKLGDMMGKQRSLLDKTFRQQQGQGDPKDGGAQGLSKQQQSLQGQLDDALKSLDPKLAGKLKGGSEAMGQSKNALQKGDLDNAKNAEQNALGALAKGAQALAEEAMKENGQNGPGGGREDPLGRANSSNGGAKVKIPDMSTLARARAILEELRKRAGEMTRPQEERDYIDRLLKSF